MCRKKCAEKLQKPQQFVGANVSFILGHFQKCLTLNLPNNNMIFLPSIFSKNH